MALRAHSIGQKDGGHVHAYLFEHGDELTLVDTLWDSDARVILDHMRQLGRRPGDLKHIVVTHAHRSHLGGLAALKYVSGARVYAHEWEVDIIEGQRSAQPVGLRPFAPLSIYRFRLGLALGLHPHRRCRVDETIGHDAAVGPLQVVHCPGHTPGHLALYSPELRYLVAGDAVASWPAVRAGWPGFNLNEPLHRVSLRRLAGFEVERLGVGHGEPITRGASETLAELAEA